MFFKRNTSYLAFLVILVLKKQLTACPSPHVSKARRKKACQGVVFKSFISFSDFSEDTFGKITITDVASTPLLNNEVTKTKLTKKETLVALQSVISEWSVATILVVVFLATLVALFLGLFLSPGILHCFRLARIEQAIHQFSKPNKVSDFKNIFADDTDLLHLWNEYRKTLHPIEELEDGQLVVRAFRATAPAEMYFHAQSVVDGRLHTEFFKHLPGVFTGLGIIGTFSGLIRGLGVFQVSENAATVRASLESLMHSVGEAFVISGVAIGLAMLVTLVEKSILNKLYRRTDAITRAIDAGFESGVGEHYLGRLVRASEDSASQSKILKDALVKEMGELLRELTTAQIAAAKEQQEKLASQLTDASREQAEAARQDNQALGETIAESIKQSLEGPLQDIASTVKTASGDQSASAVNMLQDVMSSFSERLNTLFGGQISGINQLNQQTARSMQEALSTLQTLVANIEASSRRSADTMAERMADAIEKMEARQEAMNSQSSAFIEQIRTVVASSQTETSDAIRGTLQSIGDQVGAMLERLNTSQAQAFENSYVREQAASERSSAAVMAMTESVEGVVAELSAATTQMAKNVTLLTQTTSSSVERMNAGAEQLGLASRNFATAGERVSSAMTQAAGVSEKLAETSGALTVGGSAMQSLLKDYQAQRTVVEALVGELRATVESASKEASLTADILGRIESSAQKLGSAQKQADEYLEGVSKVLADAHTSFATEVKRTLNTANTDFHAKLSTAVNMLHAAIGELELTLSTSAVSSR